jgi:hypothetical protein
MKIPPSIKKLIIFVSCILLDMKKHLLITLIAVILLPHLADAQSWKRFRSQVIGGVGVTNFLGDLGGGPGIGRGFIWDLDLPATRPSLMIGYRYQFNSYLFGRANLQWGILGADDDFTTENFRNNRSLKFRTGYIELDLMTEFYFIQNSRGNLYKLRGIRGRNGLKIDVYAFGGIGFMYFNPKGEYQGSWHKLQPLGTEGQGLPGEPDKYSRTTFTIPYGMGIGKSIDRYWGINAELTFKHTFSDYIDDVSTEYYGRRRLATAYEGQLSADDINRLAFLSDPSSGLGANEGKTFLDVLDPNRSDLVGQQRGNPENNDSYMTLMFTVSRKIVKRRKSRPKF